MSKSKFYILLLSFIFTTVFFGNSLYAPYLAKSDYLSKTIKGVHIVDQKSELLSSFNNKEVNLSTAVILPQGYELDKSNYPVVFHIPGFGGDHTEAYSQEGRIKGIEKLHPDLKFIHIFLDPSCESGHHGFVDSENNGPWENVLIKEIIPEIQKKFRVDKKSFFLTGHSSGGWSVLWLQLHYPDIFLGTWATSPDPLDFSDFYGVNLTVGSNDNVYKFPDGRKKFFYEQNRKLITNKDNKGREDFSVVASEFISNEYRYGKKIKIDNEEGEESYLPEQLYNRKTGKLNQEVLKSWSNYDITLRVLNNPSRYEKGLKQIKITTGTLDNFFLDRPTRLFCEKIAKLGYNNVCTFVEGRDHMNLYYGNTEYSEGLDVKFYQEMKKKVPTS